ncbi:hypothetical protein IFM89_027419 [Coptis chinensis]|uniref:tRNA (guanine(46)-N(7))-methyltransferase n=1 Tax=Coptis chinensis TaxID=261450 RepID=A0A835IPG5_9MAGN|nr:hypothetical protein IFM89_027419 [Coptis chinensis]
MFGIGRVNLVNPIIRRGRKGRILFPPPDNINKIRNTTTTTRTISKENKTELRSPDLVALEYADLNLKHSLDEVPAEVPNWNQIFRDSTLPLVVDIGCGSVYLRRCNARPCEVFDVSYFIKAMQCFLLVERAQLWVKDLALDNIGFLFANATVSFELLVSNYPGPLLFVSILCPDPHFKKRHHKRRVVQEPLVDSILKNLSPGGQNNDEVVSLTMLTFYDKRGKKSNIKLANAKKVFLQSDVLEVAFDMRNQFDARLDIVEHIDTVDPSIDCDDQGWLLRSPVGIRTEREIHAELEGARIYRRVYQKREKMSCRIKIAEHEVVTVRTRNSQTQLGL